MIFSAYTEPKYEHTSEEHGITPWVAFGRGHLVIYEANNCFGNFIQRLGTVLQKRSKVKLVKTDDLIRLFKHCRLSVYIKYAIKC